MSFGWHPREHRKALDGMRTLTLEERGAYNTCLDLIYDREGPVPDDSRWLAGWMGVSLRKWSTIRAALIFKGKLFAVNFNGVDCLMNERAAFELENQAKLSRKLSESGAKGGRKSAETKTKPNEINDDRVSLAASPAQAIDKDIDSSSVVPPNGETTGGSPPVVDLGTKAWADAKALLIVQGGLSHEQAGKFFGKLLAQYDLQALDLLGAVNEAFSNRTQDPQGFLTKAAQARKRGRGPPEPAKRVGWV